MEKSEFIKLAQCLPDDIKRIIVNGVEDTMRQLPDHMHTTCTHTSEGRRIDVMIDDMNNGSPVFSGVLNDNVPLEVGLEDAKKRAGAEFRMFIFVHYIVDALRSMGMIGDNSPMNDIPDGQYPYDNNGMIQ